MKRRILPLAAGAILALVASGLAPTAAHAADPTPVVSIIAGTGVAGFSGDQGPATAAQFTSPQGMGFDADGDLYVMDVGNRRIREITSDGNVFTVVGDGSHCNIIDNVTQPVTGLCTDGGLAVTPDAHFYYGDGTGIATATSVSASHYAGRIYGLWNPNQDGGKYDVSVTGFAATYDPDSGNVYYLQDHAIRAVTQAGQVTTVAGMLGDCNSGSDATTPALGSCLWPRKLAVHAGKVYFEDSSSWNGPRVRVIEGSTITTLAGNGSWGEPTLGGAATASGLPEAGGLAVDSRGDLYFSGSSRGRVWKVDATTHNLSLVTEFEGGAGWLTTDAQDNLYVSLQYKHEIAKITDLVPPPPPPACPKLQFVGVRGSGETKFDGDGYGSTIQAVKIAIETKVKKTQSVALDYPAIPVAEISDPINYQSNYVTSVNTGRTNLDALLTAFFARCSTTPVVLAGFSQGGQVAGDEFASLTPAERAHVILLMFGDPRFNPAQPDVDNGTYPKGPKKQLSGIYLKIDSHPRVIDDASVARVHSYCLVGDPVCNYSLTNATACTLSPGTCPHLFYSIDEWTDKGADFAVRTFRNLPPLSPLS